MFSGIIALMQPVKRLERHNGNLQVWLDMPNGWQVDMGESIAVNGVCSTAVEVGDQLSFVYMPETLAKTTMNLLKEGSQLNLERSLRLNDIMSGHMVSGHVDTVGKIEAIKDLGGSKEIIFSFDPQFGRYLVDKGSICVNGVSLTVVEAAVGGVAGHFSVALIPHTLEITNLGQLSAGDSVNLEFDLLAKYLEKLVQPQRSAAAAH